MVLHLTQESGKTITVEPSGKKVAVIVWRKNGGVLLPLAITQQEAQALQKMIGEALTKTQTGE